MFFVGLSVFFCQALKDPGLRRLAPGVGHLCQARQFGGTQGVHAADGATEQMQLGVAVFCRGFELFGQARFGQRADGQHGAFTTVLQGGDDVRFQGRMAGAFQRQRGGGGHRLNRADGRPAALG